jgi:hypothetical protein
LYSTTCPQITLSFINSKISLTFEDIRKSRFYKKNAGHELEVLASELVGLAVQLTYPEETSCYQAESEILKEA